MSKAQMGLIVAMLGCVSACTSSSVLHQGGTDHWASTLNYRCADGYSFSANQLSDQIVFLTDRTQRIKLKRDEKSTERRYRGYGYALVDHNNIIRVFKGLTPKTEQLIHDECRPI